MRRVPPITMLLVFVAAAPIAGIALWSLDRTVQELADPCATWDYPPGQPASNQVGPHDACRSLSAHMESKGRAVLRAALVPGGLLVAAILAIAGAAASRRRVVIAAGVWMLLETLVVLTIAPLTLLAGASLIWLSRRLPASANAGIHSR
jgi:hypothetical protein